VSSSSICPSCFNDAQWYFDRTICPEPCDSMHYISHCCGVPDMCVLSDSPVDERYRLERAVIDAARWAAECWMQGGHNTNSTADALGRLWREVQRLDGGAE
jgi:hypothetical protein